MAEPSTSAPAARLTIDLDALAHNHAVLRAEAAGAEVAPVLKGDAYGLGAGPVSRRLWAESARSFFVARLAEGEALRAFLTPDRPASIYVLDGMTEGSASRLRKADLTPVLCSLSQLAAATAQAASDGRALQVALHVDTGMNRQGLTVPEAIAAVQATDRLRGLDVRLIMSHLGSAADPDNPRNANQLTDFLKVRSLFPEARASLAASAGAFLGPSYRFDLVRPGVSLFGGGPQGRPDTRLRAVATLTAPILDIRHLRAGDLLGYGEAMQMAAPTRIALVAAGYADGVTRAPKSDRYAWFAGARRRLLMVNMDILAMDLGDAEATVGQTVELLGPHALIDDLACSAGTVPHDLLLRLSRRAERVYLGEA